MHKAEQDAQWDSEFWSANIPENHFDTPSTLCGPLLAKSLLQWVRESQITEVIEIGCNSGTFLSQMQASARGITCAGVDVRPTVSCSSHRILCQRWDSLIQTWQALDDSGDFAAFLTKSSERKLVVAIEWLDDLAAPVTWQGRSMDGGRLSEAERQWLRRWWPQPGRVVVGLPRDRAWRWLAQRLPEGSLLVTIDYGHIVADRPLDGGLAAHHHGRLVPPGQGVNTTAAVAVDSLAEAVESVGASRLALTRLKDLPSTFWATDDADPLRSLALRSQEQLLRDPGRFGNFWLVAHRVSAARPAL